MSLFADENKFDHEILRAANATGVPVAVLKGLIGVESAFKPKAFRAEPQINDASRGLMQILYRTAKAVGYTGTEEGLFDPTANVLHGAKFFRDLMLKHKNLPAAVASYNMGYPRPASKTTPTIIKIYGTPAPDWTYANQPYVNRVLAYIAYFQTFEKNDAQARAALLDLIKKKVFPPPPSALLPSTSPDGRFLHNPPAPPPRPDPSLSASPLLPRSIFSPADGKVKFNLLTEIMAVIGDFWKYVRGRK